MFLPLEIHSSLSHRSIWFYALSLGDLQQKFSNLGAFGVGHRPYTQSLNPCASFESGISLVEFSFLSPEVTAASIGPDLCVFPVTEELRSKTGMEPSEGSEGFREGASEFLMQFREPVRDNSTRWKTKHERQKCKCASDYLNKDKLRRKK